MRSVFFARVHIVQVRLWVREQIWCTTSWGFLASACICPTSWWLMEKPCFCLVSLSCKNEIKNMSFAQREMQHLKITSLCSPLSLSLCRNSTSCSLFLQFCYKIDSMVQYPRDISGTSSRAHDIKTPNLTEYTEMKPYAFGLLSSELAIFLADNELFKYLHKNPAYLLFKGNQFLKCWPVQ